MSKDIPEVGDVWLINSRKIVVKQIEDVSDFFEGVIKDNIRAAYTTLKQWLSMTNRVKENE